MAHEYTEISLCNLVTDIQGSYVGLTGLLPRKVVARHLQDGVVVDKATFSRIEPHFEFYEFPAFNGTRILFNYSWYIDGIGVYGCSATFDVLEYTEEYRPDCSDCLAGISQIKQVLQDVSLEMQKGTPESTLDKLYNLLLPSLHLAKVKTYVVRLGYNQVLTYRV